MSPSPVFASSIRSFASVALTFCSLVAAPLAYGQATLTPLGTMQEMYFCSTDGTTAIGSLSIRGYDAPIPRDSLNNDDDPMFFPGVAPLDGSWDLSIHDLVYVTVDETTAAPTFIRFPSDQLVGHTVTSVVFPRSSAARLAFINTSVIENGVEKFDAWVWYPDFTVDPNPAVTDVVRIGSNLDAKCCSADGRIVYCDDNQYLERFWRGIRVGDQYSITPRVIPTDERGANPNVRRPRQESVDCCSADGMIAYGRQRERFGYTPTEVPTFRGTYTWCYTEGSGIQIESQVPNDDLVLVCTDDGQLAIAARVGRTTYDTWTPTLVNDGGFTPGTTRYYPLAIRNNLQAFGHLAFSQFLPVLPTDDVAPVTSDAPNNEFTVLKLLATHTRGEEIEADEIVSKVLGYSIKVDDVGNEIERTLVRWIPSLSSVQLLSDVYGVQNVETLFVASRDLTKLYVTINDGSGPLVYRIRQQADPPPAIAGVQITTNLAGTAERLTVTFDQDVVSNDVPPTVNLSGGPITLTEISSGLRTFVYSLDRRVNYDEVGTLDLAAGAVTDFGLNDNLAIVGQDVDNLSDFNRPPPDTTGPVVTGAAIDADGEKLTLIFDENVRHLKVPILKGFKKPVTVKAAGRKVIANTITYVLSRTIYKDESGAYVLTGGSVEDRKTNRNVRSSGSVLNDSTVVDPTTKPPEPPPTDRPITMKRPLGKKANYFAQAAYNTSQYFYQEPYYTENAYYAYLSSYTALTYAYQAGTTVRYGGPKLPKKGVALARYKEARYQQVLNSYYAMNFAYSDYSVTGSTTMANTYTYSYYAYTYGVADLEAK